MNESSPIRLTQYSHGAGCGCKIAPAVLDRILHQIKPQANSPNLLVGNEERDDAAVYDLGDGTAIISTTDFFMPIVDDPFDFGRIAGVNAISDVYAMGGSPLMAIAILGWPVNDLPPEVANAVVSGGRQACADAGIPLAGGHSIDSPEPIFGLAVSGRVDVSNLKRNAGARAGDNLFLTKPLGVGILTTAQKKSLLKPEHSLLAIDSMLALNKIGEEFGKCAHVHSMTDVTGFGLLGHLVEMCKASDLSAKIYSDKVKVIDKAVYDYLEAGCVPRGTHRNWDSYKDSIAPLPDKMKLLLSDPQTSGGLLCAVTEEDVGDFQGICRGNGLDLEPIGRMAPKGKWLVEIL